MDRFVPVQNVFTSTDISVEPTEWKPDLKVFGMANQVMHIIPEFRKLVNDLRARPKTNAILMPEDMNLPASLVDTFEAVLQDSYLPGPTRVNQSELSAAMGAPFKVLLARAMTNRVSGRVLVVGSGYGHDVRRVLVNAQTRRFSFVLLEPQKERLDQSEKELSSEFPNVQIEYVHGTFESYFSNIVGKFDLILACNSFQFLCGVHQSPFVKLSDCLSSDGVMIGSYMDHDSYFSYFSQIGDAYSHAITVSRILGDTRNTKNSILGSREVNVYGTTFIEPYVTPEVVNSFALHHGLSYSIYRGKGLAAILRSDPSNYRALKGHINTPGSSMMTTVVLKKASLVLKPVKDSSSLLTSPQLLPFRHLSYKNIPHYRAGNYYYAIKRDGVCGTVTIANGCWSESWNDGIKSEIKIDLYFDKPVYIMCERMNDGTIYVTDLLAETFGDLDTPFILRYTILEAMFINLKNCANLARKQFFLNVHQPVRSKADIDMMRLCARDHIEGPKKDEPFEGFMLIPMVGTVYGGYQAGVKLKVTRTIDVMTSLGVVEEHAVDDDNISGPLIPTGRMRPDKTFGDDSRVVSEIRRAVPWSVAFDLLESESNIEFSWTVFNGMAEKGFIHPLNKAITAENWMNLYRMRADVPPQLTHTVLSSLALALDQVVQELSDSDDDEPPDIEVDDFEKV